MKFKEKYFIKLKPILCEKYGVDQGDWMINRAVEIYTELCNENSNDPKKLKEHTVKRIYPSIAVFKAMLEADIGRDEAAKTINLFYEMKSKAAGDVIRKIMKIPGLYKLILRLMVRTTKKHFGEGAGFQAKWIKTDKNEAIFDIFVCPYQQICAKYDCLEIVSGFCHSDDICYGNMHPKLQWGRTKTLGLGGDCCDFKLTIK